MNEYWPNEFRKSISFKDGRSFFCESSPGGVYAAIFDDEGNVVQGKDGKYLEIEFKPREEYQRKINSGARN